MSENEYIYRLLTPSIEEAHRYFQVIVVTGPRQSGKTSLCRHLYPDYKYVNLEDITTRALALSDPTNFIDSIGEKVIIDEAQNVPELMSLIQVKVDQDKYRKYILTGSSNFSLLQTVSQSLAGRAALFTLLPFSIAEIRGLIANKSNWEVICQGMYPGVVADGIPDYLFYQNYYNTYVERDLRTLLNVKNLVAFDRFIRLVASRVGAEMSASALARETGVSSVTIAEWLSILETSYIIFPLRPFASNVSKVLTKMPKYYFVDTGLLCFLLGIESVEQLVRSQLKGAIFENMAMSELVKQRYNIGRNPRINFYREKSGKEVDAIEQVSGGFNLYEVKATDTFRVDFTKNMKEIGQKLGTVDKMTVIYNGITIPGTAVNLRDI